MKIIADLQIHSRYAMATSKDITIKNLERYARMKGIDLLGTGDCTHPSWLKELKENLTEDGNGILRTKSGYNFILQGEVSNIYSQDGKLRKVHNLLLAKSFDVVEQINDLLSRKGDLKADGRPIFGNYTCVELVEDLMAIDKDIEIIPAHCLTPWFGVFGSKSGFDSIEECFKDQARNIHAIETGMSADPAMIWRVDNWSKYTLVSNSDSHSHWPWRIGREATVFDLKELNYDNIIKAIRTGEGLKETIEVNPAYGKYHWDGHKACNVCLSPKEALKYKNTCPVCRRGLTIGVEHRIEEMANKPEGHRPHNAKPFVSLIPLSEIIAAVIGSQPFSKGVWEVYNKLTTISSEFHVLREMQIEKIKEIAGEKIAEAVKIVREGKVKVRAGFDGVYGEPVFNGEKQLPRIVKRQKSLADF